MLTIIKIFLKQIRSKIFIWVKIICNIIREVFFVLLSLLIVYCISTILANFFEYLVTYLEVFLIQVKGIIYINNVEYFRLFFLLPIFLSMYNLYFLCYVLQWKVSWIFIIIMFIFFNIVHLLKTIKDFDKKDKNIFEENNDKDNDKK